MTKLKGKPFALLGVNSWTHEPGKLKTVMAREFINWRTFDDDGKINRQWNLPATPTFYIIDHKGVIRQKWVGKVGGKAIDAALAKLIAQADQAGPQR